MLAEELASRGIAVTVGTHIDHEQIDRVRYLPIASVRARQAEVTVVVKQLERGRDRCDRRESISRDRRARPRRQHDRPMPRMVDDQPGAVSVHAVPITSRGCRTEHGGVVSAD